MLIYRPPVCSPTSDVPEHPTKINRAIAIGLVGIYVGVRDGLSERGIRAKLLNWGRQLSSRRWHRLDEGLRGWLRLWIFYRSLVFAALGFITCIALIQGQHACCQRIVFWMSLFESLCFQAPGILNRPIDQINSGHSLTPANPTVTENVTQRWTQVPAGCGAQGGEFDKGREPNESGRKDLPDARNAKLNMIEGRRCETYTDCRGFFAMQACTASGRRLSLEVLRRARARDLPRRRRRDRRVRLQSMVKS